MFTNSAEAKAVFEKSRKRPNLCNGSDVESFSAGGQPGKKWATEGKSADWKPYRKNRFSRAGGADNRYHSPLLCGGAATDITVYAYEIATWLVNEPVRKTYAAANLDQTGVDFNRSGYGEVRTCAGRSCDELCSTYGQQHGDLRSGRAH